MALIVCTWKWGDKYTDEDVNKVRAGFRRHLHESHTFVLISDKPSAADVDEVWPILDLELLKHKGCFARLRMFDPLWQNRFGIDERLVCVDLDVVITGHLDELFYRAEPFMILQGANAANPCKYNGSVWMLRAGYRPDVWQDFSIEAAQHIPFYEFPDDQAWMEHKMPGEIGWKVGYQSGIYAFQKPGWPKGDLLPKDARMVVFPGWRSPAKFKSLPWVQQHWTV